MTKVILLELVRNPRSFADDRRQDTLSRPLHCTWSWTLSVNNRRRIDGRLLTALGRVHRCRQVLSRADRRSRLLKPKFHGGSFLVASSSARPTRTTSSRGCYENVARVRRVGRLSRSDCHALIRLIGRRSVAVYSAARLSVCRVVLRIPQAQHAPHDLLRTSR